MLVNESRAAALEAAERGERPVRDFESYCAALGADMISRDEVTAHPAAAALAKRFGHHAGLVLVALLAVRKRRPDVLYCDAENTGLPLALLLRVLAPRVRVFMLLHRPEGWVQRLLFRCGGSAAAAGFFAFGPTVSDRLRERLRVPATKLHVLPMGVDVTFWSRELSEAVDSPPAEQGRYIASAGREFRDYPTLVKAAADLGVDVRVAATSLYSRRRDTLGDVALPPGVFREDCDTRGLRALYRDAAVVVVPLQDVEFPAGLSTIVEAMAMGACVVVTRSTGQADVIADRRACLRDGSGRATRGGLVHALGASDAVMLGHTGFYAPVQGVAELRRLLRRLLEADDLRRDVGRRAHEVVVSYLDNRLVAQRLADVLLDDGAAVRRQGARPARPAVRGTGGLP